jgi:hypothetical protein
MTGTIRVLDLENYLDESLIEKSFFLDNSQQRRLFYVVITERPRETFKSVHLYFELLIVRTERSRGLSSSPCFLTLFLQM